MPQIYYIHTNTLTIFATSYLERWIMERLTIVVYSHICFFRNTVLFSLIYLCMYT